MNNRVILLILCISIILVFNGCNNTNLEIKEQKPKNDIQNTYASSSSETSLNLAYDSDFDLDSGLLLGLSNFEINKPTEKDDPTPISSKYKTIWISTKGNDINYIYKNDLIIAPGSDGFYIYKSVNSTKKKEYNKNDESFPRFYDMTINKITSTKFGQQYKLPDIDVTNNPLAYYNQTDNLLFVGNNYAIIYNDIVYTSGAGGYQFVPSITICKHANIPKTRIETDFNEQKDVGIKMKEIFPIEINSKIDEQIKKYKNEFDKKVKVESENDREYISEDNLTLRRMGGQWRLEVPIMFSNWKDSHNWFKDFKEINVDLPSNLVSHDKLSISFTELKKIEPELVDVISSPNGKMIVLLTRDKIKVYRKTENGIEKLPSEIKIDSNERIILNQWATDKFVDKWNEELNKMLK